MVGFFSCGGGLIQAAMGIGGSCGLLLLEPVRIGQEGGIEAGLMPYREAAAAWKLPTLKRQKVLR